MKIRETNSRRRANTLIELIAYLGVYAALLGLALLCFYRCYDHFFALRRHSEDITRAVRAGEIWRRDVRAATAAIQFNAADQTLRIPTRDHEVAFRFADSQVYRQGSNGAPWTVLLARAQSSSMEADTRSHVTAWRWEVELQTKHQPVRVRPVFTFLAAPVTASSP